MSDDLFNSDNQTEVDVNSILGENGKFKTAEDIAKAYANADKLIKDLKAKNDELEKQVMSAKTVDDILSVINKASDETDEHRKTQEGSVTQTVSKDDILKGLDEVLEKKLSAREQRQLEDHNLKTVVSAISAKFKDRSRDEFDRMAKDAGMTSDELVALAKRAPAVVVKLINGVTASNPSSGSGDRNTEATSNQGAMDLSKDPTYLDLIKRGKMAEAVAYREQKTA